jgi:drug/metabolite transporter (DMT)-like permease
VVAVSLGALLLGETVSFRTIAGAALIALSVAFVHLLGRTRART